MFTLMQLATVVLQLNLLSHAIRGLYLTISETNYMHCHKRIELSSVAYFLKKLQNELRKINILEIRHDGSLTFGVEEQDKPPCGFSII